MRRRRAPTVLITRNPAFPEILEETKVITPREFIRIVTPHLIP